MKRFLAVVATLALLGAGVEPANAAAPVVTIVGHVRDSVGQPLEGIRVSGGSDSRNYTKTRTSVTGRYVIRFRSVDTQIGLTFGDETHVHTNEFTTPFTAKAGHTYRVDRVLTVASEVAGTITDAAGTPVADSYIHLYSASTGDPVAQYGNATTDARGHYHLRARPGQYKVYISYPQDHSKGTWFGASTKKAATVITVPEGTKVPSIDGVVKRS